MRTTIKTGFVKTREAITRRAKQFLPPRKNEPGSANALVIDGMNIAYQAYYAYSKLSYKGKSTSILYGFINILRPLMQQYKPEKVIVCWDGQKHPERMKLLPTYKSHRVKNMTPKQRKKFLKQIERVRKLLHHLGITQAHNPKIEGDDMIYWVVKRTQILYRTVIVSCDKDFKQLVNWDVSIINPRTKHTTEVQTFDFENYGIEVAQYKDFLCLMGDSSDDIPGYPGVAEGRAANLLKKHYSISDYLNSNDEVAGLTNKDKLREIYKRNNRMINLRWFNEKHNSKNNILYYKDRAQPQYDEVAYRAYCLQFGLKTCVFPNFIKPFIEKK